jgi:hypothetical protein
MSQAAFSHRSAFTAFLEDPATRQTANGVTLTVVRQMNQQMVREGNEMSAAHRATAEASIKRGDKLCQFLAAENQHVLDSKGQGCVYNAGKYFHTHVVKNLNS